MDENTLKRAAGGLAILALVGCSSLGGASHMQSTEAPMVGVSRSAIEGRVRTTGDIEVFSDERPAMPHTTIGPLTATGRGELTCVRAIQRIAARKGLDGIHSVSCATSSCDGCSASGFVYSPSY